jgi:hypothetical protein
MTTIQRLPLLPGLGRAPVLPAGPAGSGPGQPGDATQRGLWRSRVAGPARLALAAAVPQAAAAPRTAGHRVAGTGVTRMRGRGP